MKRSAPALDFGLVVVDAMGVPKFVHGLGKDPEILDALLRRLSGQDTHPVELFGIQAHGDWLVACRKDRSGAICLIQRSEGSAQLLNLLMTTDIAGPVLDQLIEGLIAADGGSLAPGRATDRDSARSVASRLSASDEGSLNLDHMVGSSEAILQLKSDIAKIAPLDVPVLIVGESGTGKELAAKAIHALSARSDRKMVFVNAAALPSGLVESELFGYEAGAFTGAERAGRKGKFELADQGSLFFDEVGDMPLEVQVKLLRVLQDGVYERVGGHRSFRSSFRLISATNRNFQEMIAAGDFRLDLFYRISGVTIRMPSLRERLSDLPLLVRGFLDAFAQRHQAQAKGIGKGVIGFLSDGAWPGNIRQLVHEVEKAAIFCDGPEITVEDFRFLGTEAAQRPESSAASPPPVPTGGLHNAVASLEKAMIHEAMTKYRGNKKKVAEELGISRAYLYKILGEAQDRK